MISINKSIKQRGEAQLSQTHDSLFSLFLPSLSLTHLYNYFHHFYHILVLDIFLGRTTILWNILIHHNVTSQNDNALKYTNRNLKKIENKLCEYGLLSCDVPIQ